MSEIKPLDSQKNALHGWKPVSDYRHVAGDTVAPLLLAELPEAVAKYPIAFAQDGGDELSLVAVLGLRSGENLMVAPNGRWALGYIPSHYRGYPFRRVRVVTGDETRYVLCFDHGSGLFREQPDPDRGERRLFEDSGQPTEKVRQLLEFLRQCDENRVLTRNAVQALQAAGLLVDWSMDDFVAEGESAVTGLKIIDQNALAALDGPALASLKKANALPVAYAQVFSMSRIQTLKQLDRMHRAYREKMQPKVPDDLANLFSSEGDDVLKF